MFSPLVDKETGQRGYVDRLWLEFPSTPVGPPNSAPTTVTDWVRELFLKGPLSVQLFTFCPGSTKAAVNRAEEGAWQCGHRTKNQILYLQN